MMQNHTQQPDVPEPDVSEPDIPKPGAPVLLPYLAGIRIATAAAGIRKNGGRDLLFIVFDEPVEIAGVFTRSRCPSAAVDWCRNVISQGQGRARALVVNSGNANAFTGKRGVEAVQLTAKAAAKAVGCAPEDVVLASTGVIGEPLDVVGFHGILQKLADKAACEDTSAPANSPASSQDWNMAASAIMTSDTRPKLATGSFRHNAQTFTLNGIAKGAGMIAPDMATMLAFLFTDAPLRATALQHMLNTHVQTTFNCITVDGDTSTNDTVLLFAAGRRGGGKNAQNSALQAGDMDQSGSLDAEGEERFSAALHSVMRDLAHQIVRDGEGARIFVTVQVTGAVSDASARKIAFAIGNSPLVKTAIAGRDPNWGRVVMAVGKAGEAADRDRLSIWFGDVCVAEHGERAADYDEARALRAMQGDAVTLRADIGLGSGSAVIWTCDLTCHYVRINGDYRS